MDDNLYTAVYDIEKMLFGSVDKANFSKNLKNCIINGETPEAPLFVMMKITNRCNSDCAYCVHAYSNTKENRSDVSTEVLLRLIEEAGDMHIAAMSISGGEALVREDVEVLVQAMLKKGILPALLTNGLLLPLRWRSLGEAGLRYIIISFDSLEPDVYRSQRGVAFEKAMAGIEAASAFKETYPDAHVHITTVLTKNNAHEIPHMLEYMTERGIYVQLSPYHHFNKYTTNELKITDPQEIFSLTAELLSMKRRGMLIANSESFLTHFPDFFLYDQRVPLHYRCPVGYTNLFIDAHMNVRGCWDENYGNLGNVKEKSLREIWYSTAYCEARKNMLRCKCEGCWYLCTGEQAIFLKNEAFNS